MLNYVTLDGLKYMTLANDWTPVPVKPATSRYLLSGEIDVSYGPGVYREYRGTLIVPAVPDAGWGGLADLESSFGKRLGLSFTDHQFDANRITYTVHLFGELPRQSLSPMWDGAGNEFHVPVRLVCE